MAILSRGWTIENEVYESLMIESINHKYLPGVKMPNVSDDGTEIFSIVQRFWFFALPSSVILDVIDLVLPDLKPSSFSTLLKVLLRRKRVRTE